MTIPDAIAADLRDLFLSSQPIDPVLASGSVRLKVSTEEPPSPRLVILPGTPRPVLKMPSTARIPVVIEYITSLDRVTEATHRGQAALVEEWLRDLQAAPRVPISTRVYLHNLFSIASALVIRKEEREQSTTLTFDAVVTLCTVTVIP